MSLIKGKITASSKSSAFLKIVFVVELLRGRNATSNISDNVAEAMPVWIWGIQIFEKPRNHHEKVPHDSKVNTFLAEAGSTRLPILPVILSFGNIDQLRELYRNYFNRHTSSIESC